MSEFWTNMGFIRWPLSFALLMVLVLSAWSAARLYRPTARADLSTKTWLDAVLVWGAFAMVAGVLGTLIGLVITAESIERAGSVDPSLMWGGIKVALLSAVTGTVILGVATLSWLGLHLRWRLLSGRDEAVG